MSFINPYFLFGLFAVLIPIFLHLFNLHKVKKMEFSTLMFLKEIQKSKLRRIRIKQLLLLILRIIIITLLVFAFSNPVYKGYLSGSNPDIRKCGIFLLDNSFSMAEKDDKGSYYEQAKNSIENILKLYSPNDKLFLITSSHLRSFEKGESKDISSLIDSLKNLELTSVPFSLFNLLNYVKEIQKNENFPLYEIFILSDFQKINISAENIDRNIFKDSRKNLHFYNVDIGKRTVNNISIEKAEIKSKILENNKDIKVSVILKNYNKFNTLNKQINLFVDDKKVTETVVDLVSLERKEVLITFKPLHTGSSSGYIELLQNDFFEDEIIQDNKFYFTFYIPEKINVGLIGDNENNLKYIKLAIESAERLSNSSETQRFYNINQSANVNDAIIKSDMLIISGKNNFTDDETKILTDYINKGGGVLMFPGRNIKTESYNSLFSRLNAFHLEDISKVNSDTNINRKFEKIDFEHPIFSGAFKNEALSITSDKYYIESPRINFLFNIIPNNNCIRLLHLPGSKIFLAESNTGEGKLVFCAVSSDEEMSDFPMKSLFPLIINKSIFYLSIGEYKNHYNIVGKNNVIRVSKNRIYTIPYNYNYREPGIFTIKDSSNNQNCFFALNRDSIESNFQKSEPNEIKEFFKSCDLKNVEYIAEQTAINSTILKSREGTELWKYLIILALVFIILEMLYSKKLERM
ncbi:MAG: BatA and WFA domain-containing protein [Ignavibacteriae bacterium]|nr:BatA and WFA domain-containing protein [Ignavibacteriota bacterium]